MARTRTILTAERLRQILIYDPETGAFAWSAACGFRAGLKAGSINKVHGYYSIMINKKNYRCARLAWLYMTGRWPAEFVDHINLNKQDDRWPNLREATRSQNCFNTKVRQDSTTRLRGVHHYKNVGKWGARITVDGRTYNLGFYDSPLEAGRAYESAAKTRRREFARTNEMLSPLRAVPGGFVGKSFGHFA